MINKRLTLLLITLLCILNLAACSSGTQKVINPTISPTPQISEQPKVSHTETSSQITVSGNLKAHFIDVGQADSILINTGSSAMLIDAGNNADSNTVLNYS